jgi:phosphoribosyl 1,2-cyclic phosphodiesterase
MRFSVLGSGSRGNCVYIESGRTAILIDGGFSGKEIARRLEGIGRDVSKLDAICVTHEHNDHIAGVGVLSRRCRLPVHANPGTFAGGEAAFKKLWKRQEFDTGQEFTIKDLQIRSFRISHDTADPVGYLVSSERKVLGYCTDTGKTTQLMQQRLSCCNALILEFNHNLQLLKNGPYPPALQQRVRSPHGHLANEDSAAFMKEVLHGDLRVVILAHLSEVNNSPQLAMAAAITTLPEGEGPELAIARQDLATRLFSID